MSKPPVTPAKWTSTSNGIGYVAGWANYGSLRAWGLTPASATRRWYRKQRRYDRRMEKVESG